MDLIVEWSRFLVVFGANGVGKTTLLKLLSTQAKPDAGEMYIGGTDTSKHSNKVRRSIGVVAHNDFLYDDLTCHENLVFYGRMYSLKDVPAKVEWSLGQVGLLDRRNHRVRTLSNGMQKRLSIARAILHEPSILFLDEPEAGLDHEAIEMLEGILADWKSDRRSVVMTTHNIEQGLSWGDQIAILSSGNIAFQADRSQVDADKIKDVYQRLLGMRV